MQYKYMALAPDNTVVRGKVESSDEHLVDGWLADAGYKVVSIQAVSGLNLFGGVTLFSPRVKPKELVLFFQQLAALMRSGVPLLTGIHSINIIPITILPPDFNLF